MSERSERASLEEDENTRDGYREMAADIMATSTTKLTLFHSIRLARSFPRCSIKNAHNLASLGVERHQRVPRKTVGQAGERVEEVVAEQGELPERLLQDIHHEAEGVQGVRAGDEQAR